MSSHTTDSADGSADRRGENTSALSLVVTLATMGWGSWLMYVGVAEHSFRLSLVATSLLAVGLLMAVAVRLTRAPRPRAAPEDRRRGFDVIPKAASAGVHDGAQPAVSSLR